MVQRNIHSQSQTRNLPLSALTIRRNVRANLEIADSLQESLGPNPDSIKSIFKFLLKIIKIARSNVIQHCTRYMCMYYCITLFLYYFALNIKYNIKYDYPCAYNLYFPKANNNRCCGFNINLNNIYIHMYIS